ncbi:MAG: hypothetical protein CMH54_02285, partial [Myxococcales bacterium]|nr:hypothetical protein [Myxococcales bacterium]
MSGICVCDAMKMRWIGLAFFLVSCGGGETTVEPGSLGGACLSDGSCNEGLICEEGICAEGT